MKNWPTIKSYLERFGETRFEKLWDECAKFPEGGGRDQVWRDIMSAESQDLISIDFHAMVTLNVNPRTYIK